MSFCMSRKTSDLKEKAMISMPCWVLMTEPICRLRIEMRKATSGNDASIIRYVFFRFSDSVVTTCTHSEKNELRSFLMAW